MVEKDGVQTALVTGGSSGIGFELARICAAHSIRPTIVARDGMALLSAAQTIEGETGTQVRYIVHDLAQSGSGFALVEQLERRGIPIPDYLFNNAGFGTFGRVDLLDPQREVQQAQLKVGTPLELMTSILPVMVTRGYGRVLNVSSTSAFQPGPKMATYFASNAFLLHWSVAANRELRGTGVTVTALCPGSTKTNFRSVVAGERREGSGMDPREVARIGFDAMMAGRAYVVPGRVNSFMAHMARFLPLEWSAVLAEIIQSGKHGKH
jgi:short-subunit dehydrogenase